MPDSTKSMLSGIYEMGKSVREYIDQNGGGGGGGGGSNILAQGTYYAGIAELRNGLNISSVTKTNVGIFDIVFDIPISNREYNVLATPIGTSLINVYVDSSNEDGFEIVTRHNDSHARTDASFDFVVFGISGAGGGGGGSSSTNIIFKSDITSMVTVVNSHTNVPYVPTTDTYSAWDSSDNVWVAPRDMTVIVNCTNKSPNAHQHLFGFIFLNSVATSNIKAEQSSIKGSTNTNHSSVNLSAVIELKAGDKVFNTVLIQGANASANLSQQIMTITELSGGTGGGATPQFSRAQVSSSSRIGHSEADVDLDASQLATDSENWIHTNTTRNTVGILVPEDGLYDVSFNIRPVTNNNNNWRDNVSFLHTALQIVKADGTNVLVQETRESKNTGNGTTLNNHLYLDNLSLDQGDFLYLRCRVYSNNTSLSWAVDDNFSFLSVSKSAAGGGGVSSDNAIIQQGTYTGNSTANNAEQTINLGFTPVRVEIFGRNDYKPHAIMLKDKPDTYYSWREIDGTHDEHRTFLLNSIIVQNGFKVANGTNANASQLNWDGEEFDYYATADAGGGGSSTFSASSYQENILQDHISTDNDANLNDLHFTGLETGAYYKLGGQVRFVAGFDNAGTNMWLYAYQDSFATDNIVAALNNRAGGDADPVNATHTFNHIFQATGDLFFAAGGMNSSQDRYIYGDGSKTQTYVQLEKLGSSSNGDGGGGGSSTFAGLTDTPSTLTEGSGQYLKVSDDGQTIEYVDLPAGSVGGGSSSTISAVNQIQENIDNIPLIGSGVQIPDAILIKDINATTTNGADSLTQLDFASWVNVHDANGNITSQNFAYETNNFVSKRWYIRFNSIDGSYSSHSEDQHVKKEFNSIQEYISNDRALYFGGGGEGSSSSGGSLNSNDYIKSFSNFSGELPDAIIIRGAAPTEDQVVAGRLYYINGTGSTDQIFYDFLNWRVGFNNDPSGTNGSFYNRDSNTLHAGNSTWEFFDGATSLQEIIDNGDAIYLGGGGGYSTNNVVSAVIEADGTITSSSDDWIESVVVGNGFHTINFVSGYFTQAPSIATSIDHQDGVSHMNIEHQALTKDNVQIVHRGLGNASYTTRSQFTIMAQHQDRIARGGGGGGGGGGSSTFEDLTDTPSSFVGESGKFVKVNDTEDALEFTTFNVNDALGLQEVDGEDNCSEFHLQSDKATDSSVFEDSSVNNYSILGSNVIHSTSNPKAGFGSSSIQFNGNGQLLVADGSAFKFFHTKIIKNYTIQLWIFKDALNSREPLLLTAANNNEHGVRLIVDSDNKVKFDVMKGLSNATGLSLASAATISAQTWHHVAIVNENNTMTLYLDGNQEQSLAWTSDGSTITPNFGLSIGAGPMGAGQAMVFFNGRMQDIRVDKIAFRSDLLPPTSLLNATCDPSAGKSNIDFKMLRDTPVNYSNAGGKYVKVKDGEDGVEFVEISVGSSTTNEFSTAYVTQDQTSDGFITDLEFGNLVVGRTYRISSTICFESNDASALSRADFYNGTQRIVSLYNKGLTSTVSNSMLFVASDSSISVSGNGLTSNNFIHGLPELSFVQLELPPSVVVEIEDIPVAPVAPPGGGIFSVNDVKMHAGIIDYQDSSNTFSDIDSNAFGGNIIDVSDIRLISKIDNTGDQKTFEDLDSRLTSIDKLDLADIRVIAQIDYTGHSRTFEDFDSSLTSFGVLSFADMIINTKIYSTGTDSVMTTDPYTSHDHSFSWTGIN